MKLQGLSWPWIRTHKSATLRHGSNSRGDMAKTVAVTFLIVLAVVTVVAE